MCFYDIDNIKITNGESKQNRQTTSSTNRKQID